LVANLPVFLIAGWSGFVIMSLELLSGRILAPDFGSSIYVWGGIITVFMLALATGYLAGGRLSMRQPSFRMLCAILGAGAAATLPMILLNEPVLEAVSSRVSDPRYGSVLSCMALFFLPTAVLGMVSPYSVRLLVRRHETSGHYAGLLFFVSTFGSAAGTILTSFYFVLYLEVRTILWALLGISLALCLIAIPYGGNRVE
jgi:MFS family permease